MSSVNHPRLVRTDAESIRTLLASYDQYSKEVYERAHQLVTSGSVSTEAVRPLNLKFCVDAEYLHSLIELKFIKDVGSYEALTDTALRAFLDKKAEQSKEAVSLSSFDAIVDRDLRMDMSDKNATPRMQNVFVQYKTLLRRNAIAWLVDIKENVAVYYVLSEIRPLGLQEQLRADLDFSQSLPWKDFLGFMEHAIKLSEAFQLVENGPKRAGNKTAGRNEHRGPSSSSKDKQPSSSDAASGSKKNCGGRIAPLYMYGPCKEAGRRHRVKDCTYCTEDVRIGLFEELRKITNKPGPAKSTRSHDSKPTENQAPQGTTGRLTKARTVQMNTTSASVLIHACEDDQKVTGTGRCDDGNDDSLVSPRLAQAAVLQGIGKIKVIEPVELLVALTKGEEAWSFKFSRIWTVPRLVLHLNAGQLALVNVSFLVADDDLACEDLLIGLPVLRHLQVDTISLLEANRNTLDRYDCSGMRNLPATDRGGTVSRIMSSRMNQARDGQRLEDAQPTLPRAHVNYYRARGEQDLFPDPSILDPVDAAQADDVLTSIDKMVYDAQKAGMSDTDSATLKRLVDNHVDIFRVGLSRGPEAKFPPLKVQLTPDARAVRVKLRNYSKEQQEFLAKMMSDLVDCGMPYKNPTSSWASAPHLVPKPGPAKFCFTVDLRPVNKFTVVHQYPMTNLEHKLTKLSGSTFFETFDLSHGYWQLPLDESSQELRSIITPGGIFSPTRVLHGTTNATTTCIQAWLNDIFPESLRRFLMFWVDDVLLHASSVADLLKAIELWFALCATYNLRLHPGKCILYATSIH